LGDRGVAREGMHEVEVLLDRQEEVTSPSLIPGLSTLPGCECWHSWSSGIVYILYVDRSKKQGRIVGRNALGEALARRTEPTDATSGLDLEPAPRWARARLPRNPFSRKKPGFWAPRPEGRRSQGAGVPPNAWRAHPAAPMKPASPPSSA